MTHSTLTHLECGACAATYDPEQLINLCPACGKPLLARYDLRKAAETLTPASLAARRVSKYYWFIHNIINRWGCRNSGVRVYASYL